MRMKGDAEYRLGLIEEFKDTLDKLEWNHKIREDQKENQDKMHREFLEKMKSDKMFKQEMFAIMKIVDFQERKNQRTQDIEFEH